jgi:hypothetical protein
MKKRPNPETTRFTTLSRVMGFLRASVDAARATDRLTTITRQHLSFTAHATVPKIAKQESSHAARAGSETHPEESSPRAGSGKAPQFANAMLAINKFATNVKTLGAAARIGQRDQESDGENRSPATEIKIDSRHGSFRTIQQSLSGIETLSRIRDGRRATSPAGRAERALGIVGRLSIESGGSLRERGPRLEPSDFDRALASAGKFAPAATRSIIAPPRFSRPEFAEPMRSVYGQESRSTPGAITINSTPTVVINPGEAAGDVERQVIGALRAHREELFDQFKRESIRRERAQF